MPFTFRKSIRILPGVRLNLGRSARTVRLQVQPAQGTVTVPEDE